MRGIKVLLGLGLVLAAAQARPEGYGVKGGRPHKSSANAAAFAQASANAYGGCSGIAQSSASAIATANANASGGASNAAATANASVNGENIGKAISCDGANENANPLEDSDDLRLSSGHARDTEKTADKQKNATPTESHHIATSGSDDNIGSVGVAGQNKDRRPGCGVPGVKGQRGASKCSDKNDDKENKPSVSNPYPTYQENPDLSAGSKSPPPVDGGYGGNFPSSGSHPCAAGASGCSSNKPSVSNPYPTNHANPDSSAGSKSPSPADGGFPGHSLNSGSHPCAPGAFGCSSNKPSVTNQYPTYHANPDSSAGSKTPSPADGGYGGNSPNSGSRPCAPGASGCSPNKPSVSNPYPTYHANPESSAGSKTPSPADGGYGGNSPNSGSRPCAPGASRCSPNKPSVSNPYPTYHANPELSAGSKTPSPADGGYGGNSPNSGSRACAPGASGCSPNKPSVSNPYPTYHANPELSAGSESPSPVDGGYRGNTPSSESRPCAPGASGCSPNKPSVSSPYPTYHANPDLSTSSKSPSPVDGGYGGNTPSSESRPCAHGASGCSPNKPGVSSPYPTYHGNPDLSTGSKSPSPVDGGYEGNTPSSESRPCAPGASGCSPNKPSVSNPYPTYHENPDLSAGSKHPPPVDGGYYPSSGSHPCAPGASGCSSNKPSVSNPYPTYHENPDLSAGSKYPPPVDGGYRGKPPKSGSFPCASGPSGCSGKEGNAGPSPSSQHKVEIDYEEPETHAAKPGDTPCYPGDPRCVGHQPKTATSNPATTGIIKSASMPCPLGAAQCQQPWPAIPNPNPPYQENPDLSGGPKQPTKLDGGYGSKPPTDEGKLASGGSGYPGNPFLNGEIDVSSVKHATKPAESSMNTDIKTNPLNPFLNPHSQVRPPTGSKNPENPKGSSPDNSKLPSFNPNPSNPFLSNHKNVHSTSGVEKTSGPNTGSHPERPEYTTDKPDSSNPFLQHNGGRDKTTGVNEDINTNVGSYRPGTLPGNKRSDSNPSSVDKESLKPEFKPGSRCQGGISSGNCDQKDLNNGDTSSFVTEGYRNKISSNTDNQGVKTHQPGVKGGSRHRGNPGKLQEGFGTGKTDFGNGKQGSSYSEAHASATASAQSNAHASSSSYNGGGHSSAKSEAYSEAGSSASSHSWASSSASASAFASSNSYQGSGHWEPQIPQVPAE